MIPAYIPRLSLSDFAYDLPGERIAATPLEQRDASRLLVCDRSTGEIDDRRFSELPELIPSGALLVVNDTRVVRARIVFYKTSGGRVEIFLLEPTGPSRDPGLALAAHGESRWICLVGGARKIRQEGRISLSVDGIELEATLDPNTEQGTPVQFRWTPSEMTFGEVLERVGRIPLPPYIRRDPVESDSRTYQTIYAASEGAVAAPTAGLHFTPDVVDRIERRGVERLHVTLHVGAGTFRPVQTDDPVEHRMHDEMFAIERDALLRMIEHARRREISRHDAPIVVVGTTSLRTIESLYWAGVRLIASEISGSDESLMVEQWDPYRLGAEIERLPSLAGALEAVLEWSRSTGRPITGRTRIMIVPGYDFKCCDALVTNFHQPESTLILLVAAALGRDLWRRVYDHALAGGYRFLSYGDSSLLFL